MTPEHWQRVKDALAAALEIRPEERGAYLDRTCNDDPALRADVERLLAADRDAGTFIEPPLPPDGSPLDDGPLEIGRQVGAYVIERCLGRGGMGSVYLARRTDHEFDRLVAIKMIRRGMDSAVVVRRFRHERQILASLDHPHIARLFDGGTTDDGLPYFVMEHVEGVAIDRYAAEHQLTTTERLRLFLRVLEAVQHAHEHRIVHRDLKPGNVLVTSDGHPKLLDFGIAKILHPEGDTASTLTAMGRPMTPDYASPEQVRGEEVTPASDVYALGLLLYELLSGRRPYRLATHTPEEIARVVCDQDPERPSAAVDRVETVWPTGSTTTVTTPAALTESRGESLARLRQQLSGALDDVVLKALRKDPSLRYASASALADDIRRYLDDQPVQARRGARRYRASRFFARHRLAIAAAALVAVAVGATAAVGRYTWPGVGSAVTPTEAAPIGAARRSAAVLRFRNLSNQPADAWLSTALAEMFATELSGGGQLRVVSAEIVARVEREAGGTADPAVTTEPANIRQILGADYVVAGSFALGPPSPRRTLRLDLQVVGSGDPVAVATTGTEEDLFAVVGDAGRTLRQRLGVEDNTPEAARGIRAALPRNVEATKRYAEGLERLRALDSITAQTLLERAAAEDPGSPLIHSALAAAWTALGYDARAEAEAMQAFNAASGLNREQRLIVEGQLYEARKDWPKAVEIYRTLWGFFSDNGEYGLRLAAAQTSAGSPKEALATVEELRKLPGPQAEDARVDLTEAQAAQALGDFPHELAAAERAATRAERRGSLQMTARARLAMGRSYFNQGQKAEAEAALEAARRGFLAAGDTAGVAGVLNSLGIVFDDRGDTAKAEQLYQQSLAAAESVGDRRGMSSALNNLGIMLKDAGRLAEARVLHERALALRREVGDRNWIAMSLNNIGVVLFEQDRLKEAAVYYEEGLAIAREIGDQRNIARTLHNLAIVQREFGNLAAARTSLEQLLPVRAAIRDRRGGVAARVELGMVLLAQADLEGARKIQEEAVTQAREVSLVEGEAQAVFQLGEVALAAGDLAGARRHHEAALALRQKLRQTRTITESQVALAIVALEDRRYDDAKRLAEAVLTQHEQTPIRVQAGIVTARALLETHELDGAVRQAARARTLTADTERIASRWAIEMLDARVELAQGQPQKARARLRALRAVLSPLGMSLADLETRLLLAEAEAAAHDPAARASLEAVKADAAATGAALIRRRAEALLGS